MSVPKREHNWLFTFYIQVIGSLSDSREYGKCLTIGLDQSAYRITNFFIYTHKI